ncbi:MAG: cysteine-rich CWC family protein [Candidatus Thermoplasmatota archaeon]|nr:cysteine-rich CWC family protein [Candidatus Thermoplasmatota archaeon]
MNPLGNCWCNSYDISRENLNFLAQKYDNCLCPDCLEKYST